MRRTSRPGYTLLEVLLALGIAVLLLAAVYSSIGYQLRHAQAGRDLVEQTMLSRAVLINRMTADVTNAVALNDPARFRRQTSQSGMTGGDPSAATAGGGAGSTTTTGATNTATGAGASATGTSTNTGETTTGESTTSGSTTTTGGGLGPVQLPLGIIGSSTELHLFVSKVPGEVFNSSMGDGGQLTCDLRRISYWAASEGQGLCRMESRLITSEDATLIELPGNVQEYILAPEVQTVEFSYFDGTAWTESWDSTEIGQDEKTPKGSPRLIAVTLGVLLPGKAAGSELKYYRHVIAVPTAGGVPMQITTEGGTTP
jgi:prepilin-type N-terminal cleavage/methylation domain-containing protein